MSVGVETAGVAFKFLFNPVTNRDIPQLNRLVEASVVRDESSASNVDVPVIPSQLKVTHQILIHWEPFRDLKARFVGSRRAEQLSLRSHQRIVSTVDLMICFNSHL